MGQTANSFGLGYNFCFECVYIQQDFKTFALRVMAVIVWGVHTRVCTSLPFLLYEKSTFVSATRTCRCDLEDNLVGKIKMRFLMCVKFVVWSQECCNIMEIFRVCGWCNVSMHMQIVT